MRWLAQTAPCISSNPLQKTAPAYRAICLRVALSRLTRPVTLAASIPIGTQRQGTASVSSHGAVDCDGWRPASTSAKAQAVKSALTREA